MKTIWPCLRVKSAAAKYSCGFDMRAMSLCVGIVPETCVTVVMLLRYLFWMTLIFHGTRNTSGKPTPAHCIVRISSVLAAMFGEVPCAWNVLLCGRGSTWDTLYTLAAAFRFLHRHGCARCNIEFLLLVILHGSRKFWWSCLPLCAPHPALRKPHPTQI